MAINIMAKRVNQTEKGFRVDMTVERKSWLSGHHMTDFRFMGSGVFDEEKLQEIAEEVVSNTEEWQQGKRYQTMKLASIPSTAIITRHEELEDSITLEQWLNQ